MRDQQVPSAGGVDVAADVLETALLRQAVDAYARIRWLLLLPVPVVCLMAAALPIANFMYCVGALQLIASQIGFWANRQLAEALESGRGVERAQRWKTAAMAFGGFAWGLLVLPVAPTMAWGIEPLFIILTVVVSVGLAAIMFAPVRRFSFSVIGGYIAAAFPICLSYSDRIGFMPAAATLFYGPALIWLAVAFGEQTRRSMRNELHNALLANHLQSALDAAEYLSSHDSLTGLLNRRAFEREAQAFRGKAGQSEVAQIILLDLDRFKDINDSHGHAAGDAVLKTAARTLRQVMADGDGSPKNSISRWGGEEFIVMLAGPSSHAAWTLAEIMRSALSCAKDPAWPDALRLTASLGISEWRVGEPLHEAIGRADEAMYQAKLHGRNRVEQSGSAGSAKKKRALRTAA